MTEPMSDERLAELRREAAVEPDDVMLEALDEIDRLRAEVDALRETGMLAIGVAILLRASDGGRR